MQKQSEFISNDDLKWEVVGEGIKRKILTYDDKLMVVKVEFKKGSIGNIHQHHHSQITHVESGIFEVIINGKRKELKGAMLFIFSHISTTDVCACKMEFLLMYLAR